MCRGDIWQKQLHVQSHFLSHFYPTSDTNVASMRVNDLMNSSMDNLMSNSNQPKNAKTAIFAFLFSL